MLRLKSVLVLAALFGASVLVPVTAAADDATTADLEKRVAALEERIQNLERSLGQRLANIEQQMRKGGANQPAGNEQEAQNAYLQINRLVSENKFDEAKTQMAEFMKQYGNTSTAQRATRLNQELQVIGKSAPDSWGIEKWYQGESDVSLGGGKTTLVVFWETWCPHCQREVPKIETLYEALHDKGLQVLALTRVTKSSTDEKVATFLKDKKLTYPVAKETGEASQYFNVNGIPAAAVLKDGKVVWRGHPARLTQEMLTAWL